MKWPSTSTYQQDINRFLKNKYIHMIFIMFIIDNLKYNYKFKNKTKITHTLQKKEFSFEKNRTLRHHRTLLKTFEEFVYICH